KARAGDLARLLLAVLGGRQRPHEQVGALAAAAEAVEDRDVDPRRQRRIGGDRAPEQLHEALALVGDAAARPFADEDLKPPHGAPPLLANNAQPPQVACLPVFWWSGARRVASAHDRTPGAWRAQRAAPTLACRAAG